ncbi:PREDICTED: uncharacterized protein LOC104591179 [Nelumbo nucifera]|uniref:Uncharacterized protein LOC104591179 n=1 Tax=Nelumbo nucifera TaxID=4432 RepID=A0A1U7Z789_NELNU|nr:PREDICTED: uncharacterized protein LOC104591179 [Nelumbo nucifera]
MYGSDMQGKTQFDHTLFVKRSGSLAIYLIVYVDDIVVTGNDASGIHALKKYVLDLLSETGKMGTRPAATLIDMSHKLSASDGTLLEDKGVFQRLLGKLLRSTSGYCSLVASNVVSWRSKKQSVVARSSAEAEYRAMAHGVSELLWLRSLMEELGIEHDKPMMLYCDS